MSEMVEAGAPSEPAAAGDRFHKVIGLYLGILTVILTITALVSSNAEKAGSGASRRASDTYMYYFDKLSNQTAYTLAAEQLQSQLAAQPELPDKAKADIEALIKRYRTAAARYESDPSMGNGRKELMAKAKEAEALRDKAEWRVSHFGLGQTLLQVAMALGSASLVVGSRADRGECGHCRDR